MDFKSIKLYFIAIFATISFGSVAQKDSLYNVFTIDGKIDCKLLFKQGSLKELPPGDDCLYVGNIDFIYDTNSPFAAFCFDNVVREGGFKGKKLLMLFGDTVSLLEQGNSYYLDHKQDPVFYGSIHKFEQTVKFGTWEIYSKFKRSLCLDTFYSTLKINGKNGNVLFKNISNFVVYEYGKKLIIVATKFCENKMKIFLVSD